MRYIFLILLSWFVASISAQQQIQFSQYMLDKYQFNPAYGGLEGSLHINAALRSQWNGLDNNPRSQYINAHMPFYIWNGSLGMSLLRESGGAINNVHFSGSYNYVVNNEWGIFSAGASLGILQRSIDGRKIITPDGDYTDNTFEHNDPVLSSAEYAGISPIWNIGGYYAGESLDIGISVANIPENDLSAGNSTFTTGSVLHLYGEYRFQYSANLELMPSALVKTNFAEYQTDFSLMGRYNGNIFGSIGVRGYSSASLDAIVLMVGTAINSNYSVYYGYDAGISGLRRGHEGTHELRVTYNLNKIIKTGMPPRIIYNPRQL